MRIRCPLCATRPLSEFSYKGDASLLRPQDDAELPEWVAYVYFRANPKGWHWEYWQHEWGCGAWLKVERHTMSHEIRTVKLARECEQ